LTRPKPSEPDHMDRAMMHPEICGAILARTPRHAAGHDGPSAELALRAQLEYWQDGYQFEMEWRERLRARPGLAAQAPCGQFVMIGRW